MENERSIILAAEILIGKVFTATAYNKTLPPATVVSGLKLTSDNWLICFESLYGVETWLTLESADSLYHWVSGLETPSKLFIDNAIHLYGQPCSDLAKYNWIDAGGYLNSVSRVYYDRNLGVRLDLIRTESFAYLTPAKKAYRYLTESELATYFSREEMLCQN